MPAGRGCLCVFSFRFDVRWADGCGFCAADVTLAQKLAEELQYEKEAASAAEPDFLKSFKAQGIWTVRAHHLWSAYVRLMNVCRLMMLSETTRSLLRASSATRRT